MLEDFFFLTLPIFYVVGMIVCFTLFPIIILFWKRWLPLPARTLFWAARRGTPPLYLVHDSGRGELTTIQERKGEGIVITREGRYKILPRVSLKKEDKREQYGMMAAYAQTQTPVEEATNPINDDEEPIETFDATQQETEEPKTIGEQLRHAFSFFKNTFVLDYSDWILKRSTMVGLKMPFFLGYTGKLCLLNPEALALYEMGEMKIKTEDYTLFNPHKLQEKEKNFRNALQPLLLLEPRKIRQVIYDGFDQSQIAGVVADSEELARLGMGISPRMKIVLVLVAMLLVGIGILFLPQILGMAG